MRRTVTLHNAQQGYQALLSLWSDIKAWLLAGHKLEISVRQVRRNNEQNARLHALLSEIAEQATWAGRKWDIDDWKRLMTAAWMRTRKESARVVPAIDGHGFEVLYQRTSDLTRAECAELMDFLEAWAVEHGVQFSAHAEPADRQAVPER